ncbi:MAG: DUF6314 family protein [Tateyamaria sp.]
MPTERQVHDFEGVWRIDRTIEHTQAPTARFEGEATWHPVADGYDYRESGVLTVPGSAPMHAERRYHWANDFSVFFDDGRFFHKVPASGGQAVHWCDPDTYTVDYDFALWPEFQVIWTVRGPKKSYRMVSRYAR